MSETETTVSAQPAGLEEDASRNEDQSMPDAQNPSDTSDSGSDSDSDDEAQAKAQIEALETALISNPTDYDSYVQYIKILRKQGDIEKLKQARETMSSLFPLIPEMWREWAKDETTISSGADAFSAVEKLYERGVSDYLSVPLWCDYLNFVQEHDPSVLECSASGISKARNLFERALTAAGLHVAEGHKIWELYRDFEQAIIFTIEKSDSGAREKQILRIRNLFHRQLSIPLADLKETLLAYKVWEAENGSLSDVNGSELDGLSSHVISLYQKALEMLSARADFGEIISKDVGSETTFSPTALSNSNSTFSPGLPRSRNGIRLSGTTIIALYVDGCIHAGADGRTVLVNDGCKISGGSVKKLFLMSGNRLCTKSGWVDLADELYLEAETGLLNSKSLKEVLADLRNVAEKWERAEARQGRGGVKFPAQLGICGFDNGKPYLLLSESPSPPSDPDYGVREINLDDGKRAILLLSGGGSKVAGWHLESRKNAIFEPNANIRELILECLAASSIITPFCSGGHFDTASLKNGGRVVFGDDQPHLLCQIVKSFEHLDVLQKSLIHVTKNVLYKTCGGKDDPMNEHLKKVLNGAVIVNVLGVEPEQKITVRVIIFLDIEDKNKALRAQRLLLNDPIQRVASAAPRWRFLKCDSDSPGMTWSLLGAKKQTFEKLSKEFKRNPYSL